MKPNKWFLAVGRTFVIALVFLMFASSASAEWKEQVLYSFQGGNSDGALPVGKIVFDSAGSLYGATTQGGGQCVPSQCGTVFQLTPPAKKGDPWSETVLYIFKGFNQGGTDGSLPAGGLVIDGSGNLYGTTAYGGTGNCVLLGTKVGCGTVYELSPPSQQGGSWTETVLYSFQGGNDGYLAWGDLVFDKKGNLYGATQFGGGKGTTCNSFYGGQCGTVFELSPPKKKGGTWTEKVLHHFAGIASGKKYGDAESPNGGLILDANGAIYGTSFNGGYNCQYSQGRGCGTVFELRPPEKEGGAWKEQLIHVFKDGNDGAGPNAGVIFGADGLLYGAAQGGAKAGGIVFRLAPAGDGWKEAVLYEFSSDTYSYIPSVALFDPSGKLYGTTETAPSPYGGSVFRLEPSAGKGNQWAISFLHEFKSGQDGANPGPCLLRDKSGDLYGTTAQGGGGGGGSCRAYCGTVFEVSH
jgi:uncharacterized repeat protein (TIGR03803 family)